MPQNYAVGLISDTHGLLRPEAIVALRGSDVIIHAGDIGDPAILAELGRLAPVKAVRGNIDRGEWAGALPETEVLEAGETLIYILHDIGGLVLDPVAAGFRVVVSGHSHKPGMHEKDGVLYVNPGSAGPRRFSLPISLGRLRVEAGRIEVELIELDATKR
ncbi:MAG: metallophosphoesterase family protein [Aliidongia sp.]